jgi:hypothetical protein
LRTELSKGGKVEWRTGLSNGEKWTREQQGFFTDGKGRLENRVSSSRKREGLENRAFQRGKI